MVSTSWEAAVRVAVEACVKPSAQRRVRRPERVVAVDFIPRHSSDYTVG
jgi:hypothetical protein